MCLSSLMTPNEQRHYEDQIYGWKVYTKVRGWRGRRAKLFPLCQGNKKPIPTKRWLKESRFASPLFGRIIWTSFNQPYARGVHIWLNKPTYLLPSQSLRKVYFQGPVTYGWNTGRPTVVAQEFWVSYRESRV